jgi:2-polyprenyl-6-methoxyphenol hydroxylase-like FAD-dependent oxidoreductase
VGAGPCGLALARRLWLENAPVRVFEREAAQGCRGFGFLLLPNGCSALRRLGLRPGEGLGHRLEAVQILSRSGQLLSEHPLEEAVAVTRSELVAALLEDAPGPLVSYGHTFERFEWEQGIATAALFANGCRHEADVFVAADGVRSQCRQDLEASARLRSGRVKEIVACVRLPSLDRQLGRCFRKFLHPSDGLAVGLVPLGDGRVIWFVQFDSHRYPAPRRGEAGSFLDRHLAEFPASIREMVMASDLSRAHLWHTVDEDIPGCWSRGNVVLAGDAAHPLLPFTSQGVNMALEDAVVLGGLLLGNSSGPAVPAMLEEYERLRRPDVLRCVEAGRGMARNFVAPSAARFQIPLVA